MKSRRVQVTGGGTFFVTLPKAWAESVGIVRGAEVTLVENATGSLLVVPNEFKRENRVVLRLEDRDAVWIERAIISCYITGFDVIEVRGQRIQPEQRRVVRRTAQSLVGLEIMEEAQDNISLHCLVGMKDFAAEVTLRRISAIANAMLADAVAAFTTRDVTLASDVIERDTEADRLTMVMSRELGLLLRDQLLEREIGMSRLLFYGHHAVAKILERIGDHAVKVSCVVPDLTEDVSPREIKAIEQLYEVARVAIDRSVAAFSSGDSDEANAVLLERDRTTEWVGSAQRVQESGNLRSLAIVYDSLLRIRDYAFNIAELALNMGILRHQETS